MNDQVAFPKGLISRNVSLTEGYLSAMLGA